jgi:hypothetical protein
MTSRADECGFFMKERSEFKHGNPPNAKKAWHLITVPDPVNMEELMVLGLNPNEAYRYAGGYGPEAPEVLQQALKKRGKVVNDKEKMGFNKKAIHFKRSQQVDDE